ncbi:glutathione S-transferase D6-like isoform X3 [Schistocerca gregaria]|nr:glutathione S-transferase D6-like isoform X3 [Schistocerca gregaria]XP_049856952.1 glutathione S-transferase D6-like isoform X3 [Schistocerca gregaria]XP_049856953.1 glutathione S-transferase D6-like isoform X3 [Schistocerca gregaria]
MAPIILYDYDASPPCTLVRIVARLVGVELKKVKLNDVIQEVATTEMTQKNPQRTIPTLDDNGLIIAESRAIAMYLISKYAKDDSLYPSDPSKRALVDQRLFFDFDIYGAIGKIWYAVIDGKPADQTYVDKVNGGLETWNRMLEGKQWLAGDNITLADYSAALIVSTTQNVPKTEFDPYKYKNIAEWLSRVESSSQNYADEMKVFRDAVQPHLEKIQKRSK